MFPKFVLHWILKFLAPKRFSSGFSSLQIEKVHLILLHKPVKIYIFFDILILNFSQPTLQINFSEVKYRCFIQFFYDYVFPRVKQFTWILFLKLEMCKLQMTLIKRLFTLIQMLIIFGKLFNHRHQLIFSYLVRIKLNFINFIRKFKFYDF